MKTCKMITYIILIGVALFATACDGTSTDEYLDGDFIEVTSDTTPPDAILPVSGEKVLASPVVLQWTSKKGASSYTVEVTTDINGDFTTQITGSPFRVNAPDTVLSLDLPVQSSTYCWRVRANVTASGQYGQSFFEAMDDAVYVYCPAAAAVPDDTGMAGNITRPYQTVMAGIAEADRLSIGTVRVAARGNAVDGFLSYNELVVLREGVSLYGGYGPDFSEAGRDATVNRTIITGKDGMAVKASNISMPTVFDGFAVDLQDDGVTSYAIYAVSNPVNSLTIKNCEITGLISSAENVDSYGIYIEDSLLTVENNTVTGGDLDSTGTLTYGVYIENSSPLLESNTVSGGDAGSRSYGVYISGGAPSINESVIAGGVSSRSYGIYNENGRLSILSSSVSGGSSDNNSYGMYLIDGASMEARDCQVMSSMAAFSTYGIFMQDCSDHSSLMINNVVIGGSSGTSRGMYIRNGIVEILNNTLVGGNSSGASYGMDIDSEGAVWLQNSIIFTIDNTGTAYGIYKTGDNDHFYHSYNCYYGGASGTHYTGFNLAVPVIEITEDPGLDSGYSPQLGSPPEVRFGGVDKSDPGTNAHPYSTDKNGTDRTAVVPPAVSPDFGDGWSLGAYEFDLVLIPMP